MSGREIEVEFDDLSHDRGVWQGAASHVRRAAGIAAAQDLPNDAFMMNGYVFAQAYRQLRQTFLDKTGTADQQLNGTANLLEQAGRDYEQLEEMSVQRLKRLLAELEANGR